MDSLRWIESENTQASENATQFHPLPKGENSPHNVARIDPLNQSEPRLRLPLRHEVGERAGERWCLGFRGRSIFRRSALGVRCSTFPGSWGGPRVRGRETFKNSCASNFTRSFPIWKFVLAAALSLKIFPTLRLLLRRKIRRVRRHPPNIPARIFYPAVSLARWHITWLRD